MTVSGWLVIHDCMLLFYIVKMKVHGTPGVHVHNDIIIIYLTHHYKHYNNMECLLPNLVYMHTWLYSMIIGLSLIWRFFSVMVYIISYHMVYIISFSYLLDLIQGGGATITPAEKSWGCMHDSYLHQCTYVCSFLPSCCAWKMPPLGLYLPSQADTN